MNQILGKVHDWNKDEHLNYVSALVDHRKHTVLDKKEGPYPC